MLVSLVTARRPARIVAAMTAEPTDRDVEAALALADRMTADLTQAGPRSTRMAFETLAAEVRSLRAENDVLRQNHLELLRNRNEWRALCRELDVAAPQLDWPAKRRALADVTDRLIGDMRGRLRGIIGTVGDTSVVLDQNEPATSYVNLAGMNFVVDPRLQRGEWYAVDPSKIGEWVPDPTVLELADGIATERGTLRLLDAIQAPDQIQPKLDGMARFLGLNTGDGTTWWKIDDDGERDAPWRLTISQLDGDEQEDTASTSYWSERHATHAGATLTAAIDSAWESCGRPVVCPTCDGYGQVPLGDADPSTVTGFVGTVAQRDCGECSSNGYVLLP